VETGTSSRSAAVLPVGPAFGQIRRGVDFFVDDGPVADRRPDDTVAATDERVQEMLEVVAMEDADRVGHYDSTT
jgi:hypothetical protein